MCWLLFACGSPRGGATIRIIDGKPQASRYISPGSYSHYLRSLVALHRGEPETAASELRLALVHDAASPHLHTQLAQVLLQLGDSAGAMEELALALKAAPTFPVAMVIKGTVLTQRKKPREAEATFRSSTIHNPKYGPAYLAWAAMLEQSGRPRRARQVLERMLSRVAGSSEGHHRLALLCLRQIDYTCAAQQLARVLRYKTDLAVLHQLAHVLRSRGEVRRAVRLLREAFDRSGANLQISTSLLNVLKQLGDARAIEDLLGVLEAEVTGDPERVVKLSALCMMVDRPGRALALIDRQAKRQSSPLLRLARAEALFELGRKQEALALARKELDGPRGVHATVQLSRLLRRLKDHHGASSILRQGLTRHGHNADLTLALSQSLHDEGKAEAAIQVIRTARQGRPDARHLWFGLAAAMERAGRWQAAIAEMKKIAAKYPKYAAAHNFIGYLQANNKVKLEAAERSIRRALFLSPGEGFIIDSLGWLHYQRGDFTRAHKLLQMAARLSPREAEILAHLAAVKVALHQEEQAILLLRKAIKASEDDGLTARLRRQLEVLLRRRVGKR